jgi:DNA-binding MarR family transcriptional regulator
MHAVDGESTSSHGAAIEAMRMQWVQGGRGSVAEMVAASWVVRASQELVARIETLLLPLGLTLTKYECLIVLYASRNGALGLTEMAERLGLHPTSMTYAVDQLARSGLVDRIPHPSDRRQKLVTLTPEGRELVQTAMDALEQGAFGIADVAERDLARLAKLLAAVIGDDKSTGPDHVPDTAAEKAADAAAVGIRPRRGSGSSQRRRLAASTEDDKAPDASSPERQALGVARVPTKSRKPAARAASSRQAARK